MRNYAVAIPEITAANRIITATKNLEEAILKHPTKPIDEVEAINKLRHILVLEKCNQISLPTPKARKKNLRQYCTNANLTRNRPVTLVCPLPLHRKPPTL